MANRRGPGKTATSNDRSANRIEMRKRILIVCEGVESEPNYFKDSEPYHKRKPATTVHELVEILRKYASEATYAK